MKRLIILILIFFAAVAISPLLINEKGYILIAMGDITVESTVVTAIIMLVLVFIGLLLSLKVFRGSWQLGLGTWHKIAFASRRRGLRDLKKGMTAYVLDDYSQAEHLLAKSAEPSQFEQTAYLMAAAAAEKQNLPSNINHYLKLADSFGANLKQGDLEGVLVKIKLLMGQEKFAEARKLIDEHHKLIGHDYRLLVLEIDLCIIEQRYQTAIDYLPAARKQKAIGNERISRWEDECFYGEFFRIIKEQDNDSLAQYWKKLPRKIRQLETVLFAYCRVLAENQLTSPLNDILLSPLKKEASVEFLHRLRSLPISKPDELIHIVQKHLHQNPHSEKWLSCLGHLALAGKQWSMAEKAFNTLFHLESYREDRADLKACAKARSAQGNHQGANELLIKIVKS